MVDPEREAFIEHTVEYIRDCLTNYLPNERMDSRKRIEVSRGIICSQMCRLSDAFKHEEVPK